MRSNFHVEVVTVADKTIDVVVDIFNRVNSGGTKLSQGDLALAKICGSWPDGREHMQADPRTLAGVPGTTSTSIGCCAT